MSNSAHFRSYPPFEWPCLTSHIMLRQARRYDPIARGDIAVANDQAAKRIDAINAVLTKLRRRTDGQEERFAHARRLPEWREGYDHQAPHEPGRDPRSSICLQLPTFGQFRIALIVEVMPECTSFSFRAIPITASNDDCDQETYPATQAAFNALRTIIDGDISPSFAANELHYRLTREFWNSYFERQANVNKAGKALRHELFHAVGDLIVECQGVVLRAPTLTTGDYSVAPESLHAQLEENDRRDNLGDARFSERRVFPDAHRNPEHTQGELAKFVNQRPVFFSVLLGAQPGRGYATTAMETNSSAVLCYLDEGFATYGSTLRQDNERVVRYFVIYGGQSRHHLARIVMTLHHCGELRFAGQFDIDELAEASEFIRVLDVELSASGPMADVESANRKAAFISDLVRGGLAYRIGQLQQHAHLLDHYLRDLRIVRYPGWQSYDGFVRRNVTRELDNFVALGPRFDQIQARIRQAGHAQETQTMSERTERLIHLQTIGEIFALIGGSYYLGSIIIRSGETGASTSGAHSVFPIFGTYVLTGIFLITVRAIVGRVIKSRSRKTDTKLP